MTDMGEEMGVMIGRIDGKVDILLAQGKIQDDRHNSLDIRLRRVEEKQNWLAGAAAVISATAAYIIRGLSSHT